MEHGIFEAPIAHRGTRQSRLYSIAMPRVGNLPHAVAQHGFRLAKQRGLRFTTVNTARYALYFSTDTMSGPRLSPVAW